MIEVFRSSWDYRVQLTRIDLSHNALGDACVPSLNRMLLRFSALQSLELASVGIGYFGAQRLAELFRNKSVSGSLTMLDLRDNAIIADGAVALAEVLPACSKLRSLQLNNCLIGVLGSLRLSSALLYCTELQRLELSGNRLSASGIGCFGKAIPLYPNIQHVDFSRNGIDGAAVSESLVETLPKCHRLTSLDLSYNALKSAGVRALAGALQLCYRMKCLKLGDVHGGVEGVSALIDTLTPLTRLHTLSLANNAFGPDAAERLAGAITGGACAGLTELNLSGNALGTAGLLRISDGLRCIPGIITLNIGNNGADCRQPDSLNALRLCIETMQGTVTSLDVSGNWLGEQGMVMMGAIAQRCRLLSTLNISNTNFGAKGTELVESPRWQRVPQ